MTVVPIGAFAFFVALKIASPVFAGVKVDGARLRDWSCPAAARGSGTAGGGTNSKAPMSGAGAEDARVAAEVERAELVGDAGVDRRRAGSLAVVAVRRVDEERRRGLVAAEIGDRRAAGPPSTR